MNKQECNTAHQACNDGLCHPLAKRGLDALISLLWKQYLMIETGFENDD
jgi:hypothetical protein